MSSSTLKENEPQEFKNVKYLLTSSMRTLILIVLYTNKKNLNEIRDELKKPSATILHGLKELEENNLIKKDRFGIERHYIKYTIPKGSEKLPVMTSVGTAVVFIWRQYLTKITFQVWFGEHWGNFISAFLLIGLTVTVYPLIIMKSVENASNKTAVSAT